VKLLILGCGFTGKRVARRFAEVVETHRDTPLDEIRKHATPGVLVLHSTPPQGSAGLLEALGDAPSRVVYLSTTGVYGTAQVVDETTPADLTHERIAEERRVASGPWSSLILRPAGIYGPGRGIHERVRRGEACEMSDSIISRIHVEDLATHVEAALLSDITGAWPVADEEPCTSREIAEYCARLLNCPLPPPRELRVHSNRRVDGSAIRRALGITLQYPSYRVGIPASLTARSG